MSIGQDLDAALAGYVTQDELTNLATQVGTNLNGQQAFIASMTGTLQGLQAAIQALQADYNAQQAVIAQLQTEIQALQLAAAK
jgi:hypothetical protein